MDAIHILKIFLRAAKLGSDNKYVCTRKSHIFVTIFKMNNEKVKSSQDMYLKEALENSDADFVCNILELAKKSSGEKNCSEIVFPE